VKKMGEIRNCQFRFKCPKAWGALKLTEIEDQRYCTECEQIVYFCKTNKQLMTAIQEDRCVAVRVNDPEEDLTLIEVGMPAVKYNYQDKP